MNAFDVVVAAVAVLAIVLGFSSGLLRSLATILGYLVAAPLALAITPYVTAIALGRSMSLDNAWLILVIVFVATGVGISALLRIVVGEFVGPDVGAFDRVAGAALGAVRIGLTPCLSSLCSIASFPPTASRSFWSDRNCVRICRLPAEPACGPCRPRSRATSIGSNASAVCK